MINKKQLGRDQVGAINTLIKSGLSQRQIAKQINIAVSMDRTFEIVKERINQRSEARLQISEDRRTARTDKTSADESADKFYINFTKDRDIIVKTLNLAIEEKYDKGKLESVNECINDLQTYLNEASMYLPAFQIKKSQQDIDMLIERQTSITNKLFPKKKFGFKTKQIVNPNPPQDDLHMFDTAIPEVSVPITIKSEFFGFKDIEDSNLLKNSSEVKNKQLNLHNLNNCHISALGNPQSLQISSLEKCTVLIGPTTRSAFIKNCTDCTFVIACQQLRIHNTTGTDFYLHVTASAIIEDCSNIRLAPYNLSYPGIDEHYAESNLLSNINNWDKMEDFNWLNDNEKSPNFSIIDENDRKTRWTMT